MAQTEKPPPVRATSTDHKTSLWKRLFGKDGSNVPPAPPPQEEQQRPGIGRRLSRKVVPGLPRPGTFKRQQSELRDRLEPARPNPDERRTLSVDRRRNASGRDSSTVLANPSRLSAPQLFDNTQTIDAVLDPTNQLSRTTTHENEVQEYVDVMKDPSSVGTTYTQSVSTEAFDEMILEELEKRWILNLSMHFRDKSRREKFFVTYAETPTHWRRVTISLDYRNATKGSLEEELQRTQFQRDKSARIYEAIRESLPDIQFYDTVTNLKLQTENDRLHVHVVEDLSEIIHYPSVKAINHLKCRRVREEELVFDSHLSGFVYKVRVDGHVFIKKEIPGPDTVDEFLYEINALHQLSGSHSVIQFGGVVLDNKGEYVKGLLISFAEKGALIDVIYDGEGRISWNRRERWAKQIVQGLSEIHEAGFVQGDFTLSNIVIDAHDNAKIIDINRRGCPVGWEPPEVAALIENSQRISMYIGVKSDLYQLGMVLYALATQEDEPENHRPLNLACFPTEIPEYFLDVCYHCLDDDPRHRSQASALLARFPDVEEYFYVEEPLDPIVIEARSPGGPPYTNGHLDRSSFGHNDDFDDYARSVSSDREDDYPQRGRSTRRSRSPSPPRAARFINPAEFPLPPSSVGSHYFMGHSQVTPVPDHTEYENEITILDEKAAAASDDLPTPTAVVRLEEDVTTPTSKVVLEEDVTTPTSNVVEENNVTSAPIDSSTIAQPQGDVTTPTSNVVVEENIATSAPIDSSTITRSEDEIPNLPLIIVRDEELLSLHGIVRPEETMPTPTSLNGPEENIPLPISVSSSQGVAIPISIVRPEESIPLPSSICSNEDIPTPTSILGPGEHVPLPASFIHSNEDIPTPTSIYGPKEDFCQIAQEAHTPSSDITPTLTEPHHHHQQQQQPPRKTEAAPPTPPQTVIVDYLTGIGGAHSTVPLEIPSASLDDFLTTDMHHEQ